MLCLPVGNEVTALQYHPSNHRGRIEKCYQRESSLSFALLLWQVGPPVGWKQPWKKWAKCPLNNRTTVKPSPAGMDTYLMFLFPTSAGSLTKLSWPNLNKKWVHRPSVVGFKSWGGVGEGWSPGEAGREATCPMSCQRGVHLKAKEIKAP